jgi:hypothetical protein
MPHYVVLRHDPPNVNSGAVHWDFMIEDGPALRTWALEEEPSPARSIHATALPNHRLIYLDYEGPISGDRGTVLRWDAGDFEILAKTPTEMELQLGGGRSAGSVRICQDVADPQRWTFVFSP